MGIGFALGFGLAFTFSTLLCVLDRAFEDFDAGLGLDLAGYSTVIGGEMGIEAVLISLSSAMTIQSAVEAPEVDRLIGLRVE